MRHTDISDETTTKKELKKGSPDLSEGKFNFIITIDKFIYRTYFPAAKEWINRRYAEGNIITFCTEQTEDHRSVVEGYFKNKGIDFHTIMFNQPEADFYLDDKPLAAFGVEFPTDEEILQQMNHPKQFALTLSEGSIARIDGDGCLCEDISNEDAHLMPVAKQIDGAREWVNDLSERGCTTFLWTSRTEEHSKVTNTYFDENDYHLHGAKYGKPRGGMYVYIGPKKGKKAFKFSGIFPIISIVSSSQN